MDIDRFARIIWAATVVYVLLTGIGYGVLAVLPVYALSGLYLLYELVALGWFFLGIVILAGDVISIWTFVDD